MLLLPLPPQTVKLRMMQEEDWVCALADNEVSIVSKLSQQNQDKNHELDNICFKEKLPQPSRCTEIIQGLTPT